MPSSALPCPANPSPGPASAPPAASGTARRVGGWRGYCGIGIERGKNRRNIGTLWRSALCLDADFIFTIGARYQKQASDTMQTWRHLPYWRFKTAEEFRALIPYSCVPIGVEIKEDATFLDNFCHPERAVYILGPEDGSLSSTTCDFCAHIIRIPSRFCLNVATAGAIILYDRQRQRHA